jgi:uncharacterized membrane protein YccC
LKRLENRLNELTDTQADLERQINEFNSEYMRRLGSLIEATRKNALNYLVMTPPNSKKPNRIMTTLNRVRSYALTVDFCVGSNVAWLV